VSAHPSMRKGPDPIDRRRWTFGRTAAGKAAGGRRRCHGQGSRRSSAPPRPAGEEASTGRARPCYRGRGSGQPSAPPRARASHAAAATPAPVEGGHRRVEARRKRKEIGPEVGPTKL
jgi:hypothetical protein